MNKTNYSLQDIHTSTSANKNNSYNKPGFVCEGLILGGLFLIPAAIGGLTFGSYGINKSLQPKHTTELVQEASFACTYIDKQFKTALEIIKDTDKQNKIVDELTLEQLYKTVQASDEDQRHDIELALKALDDYSALLINRIDTHQHRRRGKKHISLSILDEANNLLSQIHELRSNLYSLNRVFSEHASYFDACELEQNFIQQFNQRLAQENSSQHHQHMKNQMSQQAKKLSQTAKKIDAYPQLKQRIACLEKQTKEQIDMVATIC